MNILLTIIGEGNKINVYGVNDNASDWNGKLQYGIFETKGGYTLNETKDDSLPANASTVIASFDKAIYENAGYSNHGAFAVLKSNDVTVSQHKLFINKFKDIILAKSEIPIQQKGDIAILSSPVFVCGVHVLHIDGESNCTDNCFDLIPGIPYTVKLGKGEKISIKTTGNGLMLK